MVVRNPAGEVRAAGGVVTRVGASGVEVLLVHRAEYDDWTLPKGKVEGEDETDEACAIREVAEETGLRCHVGLELPSVRWRDALGRPKVARYWLLEPISGAAEPLNEIDALAWLPIDEAVERLTYARDAEVLRAVGGEVIIGGSDPGETGPR